MAQPAQSLIHLEGVTKVFYTDEVETRALEDIALDIFKGEYIAIEGPSGCGKSTLLLDPRAAGFTHGRHLHAQQSGPWHSSRRQSAPARANREIGFIFQSFNLIGDLTVYENVELPLTYRGMKPSERAERATEALEKVEMAHRGKHLPSQLSGGQQQRVAVARVGGNCKFPICGNRKPHTLVVGGLCPAFHDVGESNSEGAGHRCMDGRRGCC